MILRIFDHSVATSSIRSVLVCGGLLLGQGIIAWKWPKLMAVVLSDISPGDATVCHGMYPRTVYGINGGMPASR